MYIDSKIRQLMFCTYLKILNQWYKEKPLKINLLTIITIRYQPQESVLFKSRIFGRKISVFLHDYCQMKMFLQQSDLLKDSSTNYLILKQYFSFLV